MNPIPNPQRRRADANHSPLLVPATVRVKPEGATEHVRNALQMLRMAMMHGDPVIGNGEPGVVVTVPTLAGMQSRLEAALDLMLAKGGSEGTFALGRLLATPGALLAFETSGDEPLSFVARHARGDWGMVDKEDAAANDQALLVGLRLLSAYLLKDDTKIWIITEADRSVTTVLLPDEY